MVLKCKDLEDLMREDKCSLHWAQPSLFAMKGHGRRQCVAPGERIRMAVTGGHAMISNAVSGHWIFSDLPPAMQRTQLHLAA